VTTPTRASSRPPRGEGQWALGYREPLNPNERMKKDSDGLEVRQRILDIYAKSGFDSIDAGDLRGRMRWMGLYTQRAQGIPGGKTAVLEPEELEDSYFMLRIRIDGGQLSSDQLRVIAGTTMLVIIAPASNSASGWDSTSAMRAALTGTARG